MKRVKNILIPIDFSEISLNAKNAGFYFAEHLNARVHFVHSVEAPAAWDHIRFGTDGDFLKAPEELGEHFPELKKYIKDTKVKFDEIAKEADNNNIDASFELLFDRSFEDIREMSKSKDADMIIIGVSGKEEKPLGSNASDVLIHADIPILFIRDELPEKLDKPVILAADFKPAGEEIDRQIEHLKAFASAFNIDIEFLYVNTPLDFNSTPEIEEKYNDFAKIHKTGSAKLHIYNEYHARDGIIGFSKEGYGLIAILTQKRKGLNYFFHDSTAEKLLKDFTMPLLVLK